jgi:hypothetical protein
VIFVGRSGLFSNFFGGGVVLFPSAVDEVPLYQSIRNRFQVLRHFREVIVHSLGDFFPFYCSLSVVGDNGFTKGLGLT